MELRKDWKRRLWTNKAWLCRAVVAVVVLSPLFLIEYALHLLETAIQWAYEKSGGLFDAWSNSKFVGRAIDVMTRWVGKMSDSQP